MKNWLRVLKMVLFTWGALKIGSIGMVRNGYWCTLKVAFENLL